jgi:hypothetical protein
MKKFILSFLFVYLFHLVNAQCIPTSIVLTKQVQVDSFPIKYPGCTHVKGSIAISGEDIMNLDSLQQIKVIQGSLIIVRSLVISDISGLQNIDSIYGNFTMEQTAVLDMNPIANIVVLNSMKFVSNSFTSLPAFTNIKKLKGNLTLSNNISMRPLTPIFINLDSLQNLEIVLDSIHQNSFSNLKKANTLDFILDNNFNIIFNSLTTCKKLGLYEIKNYNQYTFPNLLTVTDMMSVAFCAFSTFSGFQQVNFVNSFVMDANLYLSSIQLFNPNTKINELRINDNPLLSNCSITPFCKYIQEGKNITVNNNGPNCNTPQEIEIACPAAPDADSDGVNNFIDNCVAIFNPDQKDCNKNGVGDVCEGFVDSDCDGKSNVMDNCPVLFNPNQIDYNLNGIGDACENFPAMGFNTTAPKTEVHLSYSNVFIDHPDKGIIMKDAVGSCYKTTIVLENGLPQIKLISIPCP